MPHPEGRPPAALPRGATGWRSSAGPPVSAPWAELVANRQLTDSLRARGARDRLRLPEARPAWGTLVMMPVADRPGAPASARPRPLEGVRPGTFPVARSLRVAPPCPG